MTLTHTELKALIQCLHKIWYSDWTADPTLALKLHRHMEALFNYAEITSTLVEKNPDGISPQIFKMLTGADEA